MCMCQNMVCTAFIKGALVRSNKEQLMKKHSVPSVDFSRCLIFSFSNPLRACDLLNKAFTQVLVMHY